jgi:hypothetical protein
MPAHISIRYGLFSAALTMTLGGCSEKSDGLPRLAVSGTVTLDGQPLPKGLIQFLPSSQQEVMSGGAVIEGGNYSIARNEGLLPGKYRVEITSSAGSEPPPPGEPPGPARVTAKDVIPEQYNLKSTLTAEVKAGGTNTFEFPLKK